LRSNSANVTSSIKNKKKLNFFYWVGPGSMHLALDQTGSSPAGIMHHCSREQWSMSPLFTTMEICRALLFTLVNSGALHTESSTMMLSVTCVCNTRMTGVHACKSAFYLLPNVCFPWLASNTETTTETNGHKYFWI
jgi:hypothetical protein